MSSPSFTQAAVQLASMDQDIDRAKEPHDGAEPARHTTMEHTTNPNQVTLKKKRKIPAEHTSDEEPRTKKRKANEETSVYVSEEELPDKNLICKDENTGRFICPLGECRKNTFTRRSNVWKHWRESKTGISRCPGIWRMVALKASSTTCETSAEEDVSHNNGCDSNGTVSDDDDGVSQGTRRSEGLLRREVSDSSAGVSDSRMSEPPAHGQSSQRPCAANVVTVVGLIGDAEFKPQQQCKEAKKKGEAHPSSCTYWFGRWRERKIFTSTGWKQARMRTYHCSVHQKSRALDIHHPEVLQELCAAGGRLSSIVIECGKYAFDLRVVWCLWNWFVDNKYNAQGVRRQMALKLWNDGLYNNLMEPSAGQAQKDWQAALKDTAPCVESLRRVLGAFGVVMCDAMEDINWLMETVCIRFDATYQVTRGITVRVGNKARRVFCSLGTLIGASGKVLIKKLLPSESTEAIKSLFVALRVLLEANNVVLPHGHVFALMFDDAQKWDKLAREWCAELCNDPTAYASVLIGQDVHHWKEILVRCLEKGHSDYTALTGKVGYMVGRLTGHQQPPFDSAEDLKSTLQDLHQRFSGKPHEHKNIPRGARFVVAAEYGLCAAIGVALNTAPNARPEFSFDPEAVAASIHKKGILDTNPARDVWKAMCNRPVEYFERLLVSYKCVRRGVVPGTNPEEGWHSTLKRNNPMQGAHGVHTAEQEIRITAALHNYALGNAVYIGVPPGGRGCAMPTPGPDPFGNQLDYVRLNRTQVLKQDHRAAALAHAYTKVFSTLEGCIRAMETIKNFNMADNSLTALEAEGYRFMISNRQPLDDEEKEKIRAFLVRLSIEGATIIFPYTKVCRFIARVHLQGVRSETKVADFVREIVLQLCRDDKRRAALPSQTVATTSNTGLIPGQDIRRDAILEVLREAQQDCEDGAIFEFHDDAESVANEDAQRTEDNVGIANDETEASINGDDSVLGADDVDIRLTPPEEWTEAIVDNSITLKQVERSWESVGWVRHEVGVRNERDEGNQCFFLMVERMWSLVQPASSPRAGEIKDRLLRTYHNGKQQNSWWKTYRFDELITTRDAHGGDELLYFVAPLLQRNVFVLICREEGVQLRHAVDGSVYVVGKMFRRESSDKTVQAWAWMKHGDATRVLVQKVGQGSKRKAGASSTLRLRKPGKTRSSVQSEQAVNVEEHILDSGWFIVVVEAEHWHYKFFAPPHGPE